MNSEHGDAGDEVVRLLRAWRDGDSSAADRLVPLVYQDLRQVAARHLRSERPDHTLQPTALVNESFLRLVHMEVDWNDRVHFFAVAARTMRRILIDHARKARAAKRGGEWIRTTLNSGLVVSGQLPGDLLDLDNALVRLAELDERAARGVELFYFGGLEVKEIADHLGVSPTTVQRDLRFARAWLQRNLVEADPGA